MNIIIKLDNNKVITSDINYSIHIRNINDIKCIKTMVGHNSHINKIHIIDKNYMVSGSSDSTLKIWNINNGQCIQTLIGHNNMVTAVSIIKDNDGDLKIISGDSNGGIYIWDLI